MSYLKVKSLVNLPTLFSVHTAICQLNFKIYSKITFNDDTNEITYKIQTQTRKQTYGCWGKEIVQDFGKVMYTLLYLKWIANKDLLYSTWNSAQCYVPGWMRVGFGGEWIHVYVCLNPFTVHLKLPQHC